jgi:hypothetical protein
MSNYPRRRADNPLAQWKVANKPNRKISLQIDRWLDAALATEEALYIEEEIDGWLLNRSGAPPDFLACVAWYGRSRLLTQGWKTLPVSIPESDLDRWRQANFEPTIEEFWHRQAGAAGGFLELAGRDPDVVCAVMRQQVDFQIDQLEELARVPIETYSPRYMTDDEILDGDDSAEENYFNRLFVIRDQLECFAWALQKYRIFCLSNENQALGLPNRTLFDSLNQIDLNRLTARLTEVDPRLKRILERLARYNYFHLDRPIDPDHFWWRHHENKEARR